MSRIGAIVRRLYEEDLNRLPDADKSGGGTNPRPDRQTKKLTALKKALGDKRTKVWAARIVLVMVVLFIVAESVFQFNRLASWETAVAARRADVNRELQRRKNLIPNLVFAVGKYASYEQGVFKHVSDAREVLSMMKGSPSQGSMANNMIQKAMSRLVALAEEYPDLKATQSMQDLIREATNTEDRIAEVKREYNKAGEVYNQYLSVFPGNFFGWVYRYDTAPYIGLEEDITVPVLDLDMTGRPKKTEAGADVKPEGDDIAKQKIQPEKDNDNAVPLEKIHKQEGAEQ